MASITFEQVAQLVETKIVNCRKFKIGKTGQPISDRYRQDYEGEYTSIEAIAQDTRKEVIDNLEKFLIDKFIKNPKNKNQQSGGGDMGQSSTYYVYLAMA